MYIRRNFYIDKIIKALEQLQIVVLIGSRQVGKTTIIKNLPLESDTIYLDGQDEDVASLFSKKSIIENYLQIHLNSELNGYLLIDEFQYINNISTIIKLLTDHNKNLKVICTGSSSLVILQKIEESLAGRIRTIEVSSLSFDEYIKFFDYHLSNLYEKYNEHTNYDVIDSKIKILFEQYLIYGGMPRVALQKNENDKTELLDDIYKTYLLRDVRSFVRNEDFVGFSKLLKILALQTANMININNLSKESGLSYKKTEEYIYLLEQMYIIKLAEPYFINDKKVITKMKKVFFCDNGLRNIIINDFKKIELRSDSGSLFENFVFLELQRKRKANHKIYYYRTLDGSEVDFIYDNSREVIAFESKYKNMVKTKIFRNVNVLHEEQVVRSSYIINRSLNAHTNNMRFLPAVLLPSFSF